MSSADLRRELQVAQFGLLGYIAVADGPLTEAAERNARELIVSHLAVAAGDAADCRFVLDSFKEGTDPSFDWKDAVFRLRTVWNASDKSQDIRLQCMNSLVALASAVGASPAQVGILKGIARRLGMGWLPIREQLQSSARPESPERQLASARAWFGVSPNATLRQVHAAYLERRRTYGRLTGMPLPDEIVEEARQSLWQVDEAYALLRQHHSASVTAAQEQPAGEPRGPDLDPLHPLHVGDPVEPGDDQGGQHFQLTLGAETMLDPSPVAIQKAVSAVEEQKEEFAILERGASGLRYVQCYGDSEGFQLEYQDGSLQQHYEFAGGLTHKETVLRVFLGFFRGDGKWKQELPWRRMQL